MRSIIRILLLFLWWSTIQSQGNPIFPIYKQYDNITRQTQSNEISRYLSSSIKPCDDFYEYSCGNWQKIHGNINTNATISAETILQERLDKNLLHSINENVTLRDSSDVRKLKIFYKSCLAATNGERTHQVFISNFIKQNGPFPATPGSKWMSQRHNYDWQLVVALLRYRYGLDILVGIAIDINYQNLSENSIYLTEPSTLIPKHLCGANNNCRISSQEKAFEAIEIDVAKNLKSWLTLGNHEARQLAANIVYFEYELCSAMTSEDPSEYQTITPAPFQAYTRETLKTFTHQFNNTLDFDRIVTESYGVNIYKPVYMRTPKYYKHLINSIANHNATIIANYIMYRALSQINFPLDDTDSTRPLYCLNILKQYFPKILGEIFFRDYINEVDKDEVEGIYEKLKEIFYEKLSQNWIQGSTNRLGKKKLDALILKFPIYDKSSALPYVFDSNNYWQNLDLVMQDVRAYELRRLLEVSIPEPKDLVESYETRVIYRPFHNRIDLGWGLLQMPYFYHKMPYAMRFAILGQKLAEALAMAFDEYSWTYDAASHNNLDPSTTLEFRKQTSCFRQQISDYLHNCPNGFNNTLQLRLLCAKSLAINVAFNSYLKWLHYQNPHNDHGILANETLPELNFSNTQLFFITFAQMNCKTFIRRSAKGSELSRPIVSPLQYHSIERYKVNGVLSNFVEFAREFKCPLGSEMNFANKCTIYK